MSKILVIGATGNVGKSVVAFLQQKGQSVRAATRTPHNYPATNRVEAVAFEYDDPATYGPALAGVERVYVQPRNADTHADQTLIPFLEAAKSAGVKQIVLMTAVGVDQASDDVPYRKVEKHLMASGVPYTIVRPNWFMQNFYPGFLYPGLQTQGVLYVPAGTAQTSFIDTEDIGAVVAEVLTNEAHFNKEYTLTGGEALTYEEAVAILAQAAGRPLSYQAIDDADFQKGLLSAGWYEDQVAFMSGLFAMVRQGLVSGVTTAVADILGRAPRTLAQYAQENAAAWHAAATSPAKAKIAIIGTGNVGTALGNGWAQKGHSVFFGTRDAQSDKIKALLAQTGDKAQALSLAEAVAAADVVVLTVPWAATQEIVQSLDLSGKIVVDCTNPLKPGFELAVSGESSAGELVAEWAKGAQVVKAFNTTGAENMANPLYEAGALAMFICGDDAPAKAVVGNLAADLGFEVADVGGISAARYLESLALVWIRLAFAQGWGRGFGFKLIKR